MERTMQLIKAAIIWYQRLSAREKHIILAAVLFFLSCGAYYTGTAVTQSFSLISGDIIQSERDLETVSVLLSQYSKIRAQRDQIEQEYKSVEFKEGVLSYLEDLIRRKLGLTSGFTITPRAPAAFGGSYQQVPFTIKLTVSDFKALLSFLSDLISGPQPLLMTRLDIRTSRNGESLDVDLDVSSISQAKGASNAKKEDIP